MRVSLSLNTNDTFVACSEEIAKLHQNIEALLLERSERAELRRRVEDLQYTVDSALPLVKVVGQLIDWTEDVASASTVMNFKEDLIQRYSERRTGREGPLLYCMLTHKFLPSRVIIGGHIWKKAWWK